MTDTSVLKGLIEFEESAIAHANATDLGDHRLANQSYENIARAVKILDQLDARAQLLRFLDHDCIGVRVWSATYLLNTEFSYKAVEALKIAGRGTGAFAFDARTTLSEWKKGNLRI
jgi:hypothetical protein